MSSILSIIGQLLIICGGHAFFTTEYKQMFRWVNKLTAADLLNSDQLISVSLTVLTPPACPSLATNTFCLWRRRWAASQRKWRSRWCPGTEMPRREALMPSSRLLCARCRDRLHVHTHSLSHAHKSDFILHSFSLLSHTYTLLNVSGFQEEEADDGNRI